MPRKDLREINANSTLLCGKRRGSAIQVLNPNKSLACCATAMLTTLVTPCRARKRRSNARSHAQEGREHQRQKKKTASNPLGSGLAEEDTPASRVSVTSQPSPDLLSNKVVFKVYRKVAQEMQDADLQRALGLLQNLECCWEAPGDRQRLGSTLKLLDLWDQQGSESANPQLPQKLRKRLRVEVAQGRVSDLSLEEMQAALYSHVAQSFEGFWAVVSEGLSRHGVQHTHLQEEGWAKLEPLLHSLAAKVALKHLRNRKAQVGSAATARPSQEDKASFCRSLRAAAEGWPSLEMLHFLQYLQVHGPPVLETGLCFQLEVQKFKNAHHGTPNGALLRKKVQVIRDSFLLSQLEPRLQVVPRLGTRGKDRARRQPDRLLLGDRESRGGREEKMELSQKHQLPDCGYGKRFVDQSRTLVGDYIVGTGQPHTHFPAVGQMHTLAREDEGRER